MASQVQQVADAIIEVGRQSGQVQQGLNKVGRSVTGLAVSLPNDEAGFSRRIRTELYAAADEARNALVALEEFSKTSEAFAQRLVGGAGGRVGGTLQENDSQSIGVTDRAALADYTGSGHAEINTALRGDAPIDKDIEDRASALSSALAKLPNHRATVTRGVTLTPAQISRYTPGSIITERAFTSSSSNPAKAFGGNAIFTIYSKSGKDVHALSAFPYEAEVLFDRGTRFYVDNSRYREDLGRWVISLVEIAR